MLLIFLPYCMDLVLVDGLSCFVHLQNTREKRIKLFLFSVLHVWERGMSVVWRGKNSHFKSGVEGSIVECEFYCTAAGHISQTSSQTCRRGT